LSVDIYAEKFGHGYLLAGDFFGDESDIQEHEVRVCEIMCTCEFPFNELNLEKLANYDGLTGLLNSRSIRNELKAFQRPKAKKYCPGCSRFGDIDFSKN